MDASKKKLILIGIASTAGLLLLAGLGWFLYFKLQFSVYQDGQYKFSIKYPKGWKVVIAPQPNVAVVFLRPKDTALDTLQENFNVTIQPLPPDVLTLAAFSGAVKRQMTGVFKQSRVVEEKSIQWGWREGHELIMEDSKPGYFKLVSAWVIRSNEVYIMTFLGDIKKYPQDALFVNEMVHSLQLQ